MKKNLKKIYFPLLQDKDGYPPFVEESLWALKVNDNEYLIDNVPFYLYDLSLGDKVSIKQLDKKLVYDKTLAKSDNSTLRIYCQDKLVRKEIKKQLNDMGCIWEGSNVGSLSAISVPGNVSLKEVGSRIKHLKKRCPGLDFEEASIRNTISTK